MLRRAHLLGLAPSEARERAPAVYSAGDASARMARAEHATLHAPNHASARACSFSGHGFGFAGHWHISCHAYRCMHRRRDAGCLRDASPSRGAAPGLVPVEDDSLTSSLLIYSSNFVRGAMICAEHRCRDQVVCCRPVHLLRDVGLQGPSMHGSTRQRMPAHCQFCVWSVRSGGMRVCGRCGSSHPSGRRHAKWQHKCVYVGRFRVRSSSRCKLYWVGIACFVNMISAKVLVPSSVNCESTVYPCETNWSPQGDTATMTWARQQA